jgi:glycosyltransferase involved in cell wall biosynthesis
LRRFRERVTVIPNGVDCQLFAPSVDGAEIRHRYGLEGCFVVLFVAALTKWHRYKGLDVLLDAFQAVRRKEPKARLLVVGEGDLLPEYASKARRLGIQSSVTFVGGVPDPTLPCFYASADVLVLPSRDKSEGFGLTLLEANACGKPVIGSKVGGVPSVVKDGFNGFLVPPNDPPSLANAILTLLRDERLRLEMGKNGRGWAEQHDWSMVAEATVELYCEVLKQT